MLLLVALLSACVTKYRTVPPGPIRSAAPIAASYDKTWETVVSYFADRNIPIRTIEKASGIIVAEPAVANIQNRTPVLRRDGKVDTYKQSPPVYADCGGPVAKPDKDGNVSLALRQRDPSTAVYNLRVLGDASKSTVQANVRYSTYDQSATAGAMREPIGCVSTGKWETEIETYIKQRAETGK